MRVVVAIIFCALLTGKAHADDCKLERGAERTVARVLDAETLLLDDGSKARLAGILVPRAGDTGVAAGRWPAERAATAAFDALVTTKAIRLSLYPAKQDRHGHTLAHVHLVGDDSGRSVQEHLLAAGHARVDAIDGQRACIDTLIAAEADARTDGRGLWREPAYRVRAAMPARDILAFRGTFQIITGTIVHVASGRDAVRLILGDDRRRDLALAIRNTDRDTAGRLGGDLKQLQGRTVEARGWLIQRATGGPEIDISLAGHVRLIDGAPPPEGPPPRRSRSRPQP